MTGPFGDPFFVDSSYRYLSQLYDRVAYSIEKLHENRSHERECETFEAFFRMMDSKLLTNGSCSEGYGLKIFPKRQRITESAVETKREWLSGRRNAEVASIRCLDKGK